MPLLIPRHWHSDRPDPAPEPLSPLGAVVLALIIVLSVWVSVSLVFLGWTLLESNHAVLEESSSIPAHTLAAHSLPVRGRGENEK